MEQTWYLFPGQTLENSKPEERGKALIASPQGWKKITGYLTKKAEIQAMIDAENAHRQYLKDGSKNMTANWENSIEKMRQRRLEEHDIKIREREEELYRRFHELRAEQAEERTKIVAEARKRINVMKQDSRTLNSALLLTEVLTERGIQQAFDKKIQEEENEEDEYAKLVVYNANQEKMENDEKKRSWKEKELKYCDELKKQIKQREENNKKEFDEKRAQEIEDNKQGKQEFEAIKQYEHMMDRQKKANVKKVLMDFREEQRILREEAQKQDEAENSIVKLYARSKAIMDQKKKDKDLEFRAEQLRIRERISAKLGQQASGKEAEEAELLRNQEKELEEKTIAREKADEEFKEKIRQERIEERRKVLAHQARQDKMKKELEEWELVNRLKKDEVLKDYEQRKAQSLFDEKIAYRKILDAQMKEDTSEYDKFCSEQELLFYKKKLEDDDNAFFSYAQEVLDLAKSRGRSTIPIERVIHKYKMENNLEPKRKNISHLKSKVPINNKEK